MRASLSPTRTRSPSSKPICCARWRTARLEASGLALCFFMAAYAVANVVVYTVNMDYTRADSAGTDFTTLTSFALAVSFVAAWLALTLAAFVGYAALVIGSIVLVLAGTALGVRHQRRHGALA